MNEESTPIQSARDGIALVSEILKAAGDNPNVKEAGGNLGKTALTITKTINNALLPLAAVNFAFDKARKYFAEKFNQDLAEKAASIPPEDIVEPKASIAGPALQGLAFTHEEPSLRDMYLNLLATAMDGRNSSMAHPAFVEIIKQLTADEAVLLKKILPVGKSVPIIRISVKQSGSDAYMLLAQHLISYHNINSGFQLECPDIERNVVNWIRLGLIDVDYTKRLTDDSNYTWAEKRPEYLQFQASHCINGNYLEVEKGVLVATALGTQFAKALGL
jgi:hypothetical protein